MLDLIIRNGRIVRSGFSVGGRQFLSRLTSDHQVTAAEILPAGLEIGVKDGKIAMIGRDLEAGSLTQVVDAEGAYITPG